MVLVTEPKALCMLVKFLAHGHEDIFGSEMGERGVNWKESAGTTPSVVCGSLF